MEEYKEVLCDKCGCPEFDYDSYYDEYSCERCGWLIKDADKILAIKEAKKKKVKEKRNKVIEEKLAFAGTALRQPKKEMQSQKTLEPPKFIEKRQTPSGTYEVYQASSAESAKNFLKSKKVHENKYYIKVETPEGNWGVDIEGLYLEKLLPFQQDSYYINSAEYEGSVYGFPDRFSLQGAAEGIGDNFIVEIECSGCEHHWVDGLRYQNLTVVRCPKCKGLNKVDSSSIRVEFGEKQKEKSSNKCKRCGQETLGTAEYVKKVEQEGWTVHGFTQKPQPPPGFIGNISKFVDFENQRGFRCRNCGRVYCMDCLFSHPPAHPSGGKACFKCGGAFEALS